MSQMFKIGTRVRLKSFHGEIKSPGYVEEGENYWALVGEEGEVVSDQLKVHPAFPDKGERALIKFDKKLTKLGLVNHNYVNNSLWIFIADLKIV